LKEICRNNGKEAKEENTSKEKASQRNCESGRDDWGLCGSNSSDSESP